MDWSEMCGMVLGTQGGMVFLYVCCWVVDRLDFFPESHGISQKVKEDPSPHSRVLVT